MNMLYLENLNISAGISSFENPTLPFLEKALNLDDILVGSPSSTQLIASPNRLISEGIDKDDWLIVNAALTPAPGDVLYASVDNIFGIATFEMISDISVKRQEECIVIGVVQQSVHFFRTTPDCSGYGSFSQFSLHETLVESEHSTVLAKASGNSMLPFIHNGDLLLIERHLNYKNGDVVIVALDGDLIVKRIDLMNRQFLSDNYRHYPAQRFDKFSRMSMEGVLNKVIRLHRCIAS